MKIVSHNLFKVNFKTIIIEYQQQLVCGSVMYF